MKCKHCESERIASISGKCSDRFYARFYNGVDYEGYVPNSLGIGGGDNVEFDYCLDCGMIQDKFPIANLPERN